MNRHISALAAVAVLWTQSALAQTAPAPVAPPATPPAPAKPPAAPAAAAPAKPAAPPAKPAAAPAKPATAAAAAAPVAPPAEEAPPAPEPDKTAEIREEVSAQRADIDEQDARILELEKQLKAVQAAAAAHEAEPKPAPPPVVDERTELKISGYAQAQYELHQDSEDQQLQGGALLNQNRFLIRRARVRVSRDWKFGGLMMEMDGNTTRGPAFGLQRVEATLAYRNEDFTPLISFTMGLFDNPFGRELVESSRERHFMERSFGSRAFFPAEPDLGFRVAGQYSFLRYAVAVVNGQPLGDRTGFILQDPNAHKDVLGRVGVAVDPRPNFRVTGGVSVLNGKGYKAGSDATKNTIVWRDQNEDGQFSPGEFQGVPGRAAVAAQNFDRWLIGADLGFELETRAGKTKLHGELTAGSNMDRNVFIADPITTSFDQREFAWYLQIVHEFKQGPIVGFRYDSYNPNSDFLDRQQGRLIPAKETVTTYAPILGFQIPKRAKLMIEYDIIRDSMARNSAGVATDKANNTWTLRLQGEL